MGLFKMKYFADGELGLRPKQSRFARMVALLILHTEALGYEVTFGEAYRTPEAAKLNAGQGIGIARSLHCQRLAIDLNLFRDGEWLQHSASHEPLGLYWESIGGTWGGRFGDGNHYSLAHEGAR